MIYSKYNKEIEKDIYNNNKYIVGVDEVGRGPLAGPVVACAVIMNSKRIDGVTDSKKLSKKNLIKFDKIIRENALAFSFGIKNNKIIDKINIKNATKLAMIEAIDKLKIKNKKVIPDIVLIDAERLDIPYKQLNIVKGDLYNYTISCASILAKVFRDNIMIKFDKIYEGYDFINNKGYGTKKHFYGIDKFGVTPIHRLSFLNKYFERQISFL